MASPIGSLNRNAPPKNITADYTASFTDDYQIIADATSGAITVTLPASPGDGAFHEFIVQKSDSGGNAVTVTDSTFTFTLSAQYDSVICQLAGSSWIGVSGFDRSGTGDFEGPSSSTNGDIVTFSGSTGKQGADSGIVATTLSSTASLGAVTASAGSSVASVALVNASIADSKAVSAAKGSPLGQIVVSATSVVTPNANATVWFVEAIGCGGGGGGVSAAANSAAAGGGGGAGSYSNKWVTTVAGSTFSIGIGAAGAAGSAGVSGGTGGSVLVSTVLSVTGGAGGLGASAVVPPGGILGGAGGAAGGGGTINMPGVPGLPGLRFSGTSALGGNGAATRLGGNGQGGANDAVGADATANTGSGGGGAACNGATARAGGAGATGIVIITEYR